MEVGQRLWVPGQLPGTNDLVKAAKGFGGRGYGYAKIKRQWSDTVVLLARAAKLRPVQRARFRFTWCEAKRNRDPDNFTAGGRKVILDGLVCAGVLPGDGWAHVEGWQDTWEVGAKPGVLVELFEVP